MTERERSEGESESDELFGVERRKALIGLGAAALLSLGAVAAIGRIASYGDLLEALRRANLAWLPVALLGELVAWVGYVVAYRSVASADGGPVLRLRDAAGVVTLGLGAYAIGSSAGGLTVDFWAMRAAGSKTHEAARRTLALNTLQAAGLAVFALVSAIVVLALGPGGHAAFVMAVVWAIVVPAAVAGAVLLSSGRVAPGLIEAPDGEGRPSGRPLGPWLHWLWAKLRRGFADAIAGVVVVRHVVSRPRQYFGGLVGYPLFWLGDFFTLWIALHAFGYDLSPPRLVVAEATAWAISFLPLPGGGSGFAEAAMASTLHAVGVPLSIALFAALVYRAINFWLPIVPALAMLARVEALREALSHTGHADPDDVEVHAA